MSQPHLPPDGCSPQAPEWGREPTRDGGGWYLEGVGTQFPLFHIPETLYPNPSLGGGSWAVLEILLPFCLSCVRVSATVSLSLSLPSYLYETTSPLLLFLSLPFFHVLASLCSLLFFPCASGHTFEDKETGILAGGSVGWLGL